LSERRIRYCVRESSLGKILVAATDRGVCLIRFGSADRELHRRLQREFPYAATELAADPELREWSKQIGNYVDGRTEQITIPLDVRGSRFQRRVWSALARIPRGETRSYADVAQALKMKGAARAVGRACATNPVPILVPCHRVVRTSGELGGYGGGAKRKRALLGREGAL
jgi:AraC family transcriptional regulator of adaptative response/methylated-DNA-[protein]-cysteine methyltransferase